MAFVLGVIFASIGSLPAAAGSRPRRLKRQRDDLEIGQRGVAVVVRVKRLGDDDFVARVADNGKGKEDGFRAAAGDDDVLRRQRNFIAIEITSDRLPQFQKSLGRPVAEDFVVIASDGVEDRLRRRDIRDRRYSRNIC